MIDLLIPDVKEPVVDLYGKPELLFFGPDGKLSSSSGLFGLMVMVSFLQKAPRT